MSEFKYRQEQPIILGLAGKAGSGKTSVAESIVPKGSFETHRNGIKWDHIFFALPLYELASIKKNTQGMNSESRKKFAIHDVLYDIYGRSPLGFIPDYDSFIAKVNNIYNLPIEPEGSKPRSFLQKAGDICREGFAECFCRWGIYKASTLYRSYVSSLSEDEQEHPFCVIISDVRFENEAQSILKMPNGVLVYYDAEEETLNDRLLKRDGRISTPEQSSHISEQQSSIVKEMASFVINTDNMNIEQQTEATLSCLGL